MRVVAGFVGKDSLKDREGNPRGRVQVKEKGLMKQAVKWLRRRPVLSVSMGLGIVLAAVTLGLAIAHLGDMGTSPGASFPVLGDTAPGQPKAGEPAQSAQATASPTAPGGSDRGEVDDTTATSSDGVATGTPTAPTTGTEALGTTSATQSSTSGTSSATRPSSTPQSGCGVSADGQCIVPPHG